MIREIVKPRFRRGHLYQCERCGRPVWGEDFQKDGSHEGHAGIPWSSTRYVCVAAAVAAKAEEQ
jgi:hypothetical protein